MTSSTVSVLRHRNTPATWIVVFKNQKISISTTWSKLQEEKRVHPPTKQLRTFHTNQLPQQNQLRSLRSTRSPSPTNQPDQPQPTNQPTNQPTRPTNQPDQPTNQPTGPTNQPDQPTNQPTNQTNQPTNQTNQPTNQPDQPNQGSGWKGSKWLDMSPSPNHTRPDLPMERWRMGWSGSILREISADRGFFGEGKSLGPTNVPGDSSRDLFGMVKWLFQGVQWPPTRGWKGHFESPGNDVFVVWWIFFDIFLCLRKKWEKKIKKPRKNQRKSLGKLDCSFFFVWIIQLSYMYFPMSRQALLLWTTWSS